MNVVLSRSSCSACLLVSQIWSLAYFLLTVGLSWRTSLSSYSWRYEARPIWPWMLSLSISESQNYQFYDCWSSEVRADTFPTVRCAIQKLCECEKGYLMQFYTQRSDLEGVRMSELHFWSSKLRLGRHIEKVISGNLILRLKLKFESLYKSEGRFWKAFEGQKWDSEIQNYDSRHLWILNMQFRRCCKVYNHDSNLMGGFDMHDAIQCFTDEFARKSVVRGSKTVSRWRQTRTAGIIREGIYRKGNCSQRSLSKTLQIDTDDDAWPYGWSIRY